MEQIEKIQGTEKEFIKVFQELCYSRSSWQVWADGPCRIHYERMRLGEEARDVPLRKVRNPCRGEGLQQPSRSGLD